LKIDNLECVYQEFILAISGVSLALQKGQLYLFLEQMEPVNNHSTLHNGARPVLKPLEGKVKKGTILFNGNEIISKPTPQVVKMVFRWFQKEGVFLKT